MCQPYAQPPGRTHRVRTGCYINGDPDKSRRIDFGAIASPPGTTRRTMITVSLTGICHPQPSQRYTATRLESEAMDVTWKYSASVLHYRRGYEKLIRAPGAVHYPECATRMCEFFVQGKSLAYKPYRGLRLRRETG
jgi:hypothetical protein